MQKKISKNHQARTLLRAARLRSLLKLEPSGLALLEACAKKPTQDVRNIIEAIPNMNTDAIRDNYLRTPLHIACGRRDDHDIATNIADILIEAGSDVNNGVGDIDGLQPMHMAVLAENYQCVLLLLRRGASVPASSPFRLTPLLLAKLKLDNLRQNEECLSESAKTEYNDLTSITQVLVTHLASKHVNSGSRYHGLSEFLFSKDELNETIDSITSKLDAIEVDDVSLNGLIAKVKRLGINELK